MRFKSLKYASLAMVMCLASVLAFTGCTKDKKENNTAATEKPAGTPMPTLDPWATAEEKEAFYAKMAESIELEKSADKYEFDLKENVPNDKYGNYYQIFVYSYCDSNGDGIGDLNGITSKLDYIKDMGFNGIWLTPIFQAREYHKYHTTNYMEIDPQFGTMEDFEKLVSECNKRGIRLILDLVMNHTGVSHEWYQKAKESITNNTYASDPYFKYYNFSKEKKENYYPLGDTGFYYEGSFNSQLPDLNLEDANVRKEFETIAKFWLDKGIDGFRLDAALHFVEDNTEKNDEILKWFTDYVYGIKKDAYIVAEVWTAFGTIADYYDGGLDSCFNFAFGTSEGQIANAAKTGEDAQKFETALVNLQDVLKKHSSNSTCIDAPFVCNHDVARMSGYVNEDETKIKIEFALLQMMSGNSFVYYGDEIGMAGSGANDTNYRAPMYWSDQEGNGNVKSLGKVTNADHKFGSVEAQQASNISILNYVKRLNGLRNAFPEIARGEIKVIDSIKDTQVVAITKTYKKSTITIMINTSKYNKELEVDKGTLKAKDIVGYASSNEYKPTYDGSILKLPAGSVVILK